MPIVTSQPYQISYFVQDITLAMMTYNRLRWHRSRSGENGLYEPATSATAQPAVISGSLAGPHEVNGRVLSVRINGVTTVTVTFADPDPVTTTQVAAAINGATALIVASADADDKLVLTTVATGSAASIEILPASTAAPFLGLEQDAVGRDVDATLVLGTHQYFLIDQNSDPSFWYKIELINTLSDVTTGLSVAIPADSADSVPASRTIVAYVRLADMSGRPIAGRNVTFSNAFLPNTVVDQTRRWGVFRHNVQMTTDSNGYAETRLLRGMSVDISIDGTGYVRRITIPTSGDVADVLDPALVSRNEFSIHVPNIDFAVRTT